MIDVTCMTNPAALDRRLPSQPLHAATSTAAAALVELAQRLSAGGYRFTTVTPVTHERVNQRPGNTWAVDLQGIFGWSRPFRADVIAPQLLALMQRADVLAPWQDGWRSLVRFSTLNDELFMHSAFPTEEADAVFFGPDTYRFAAAIQAHLAQRAEPMAHAVDIGCGAGPGAVLIALAQPKAQVLALDINAKALHYTALNADVAGVDNLHVQHSDLLSAVAGQFDLIVANPPYMADPAKRFYRDGGGSLGSGLSLDIVRAAMERLAPGGTLLLYTGIAIVAGHDPFLQAIAPLLNSRELDWHYREMDPDVFAEELLKPAYAEVDRIAAVVLEVTRRAP